MSIFRYDPLASDGQAGSEDDLKFVDLVVVEWWWEGKRPFDYKAVVNKTIGNRFAMSSKDCYVVARGNYSERDDLRTGERLSLTRLGWVVGIRLVRLKEEHSNGEPPPVKSQALRDRKPTTFKWGSAYKWLEGVSMEPTTLGEPVFALDKVDCDPAGNFMLGSLGRVAEPVDDGGAGVRVARESMLAANQYLGASGTTQRQAQVDASVDDHHYWCAPKKEVCYEKVDFGDFSVPTFQGQVSTFDSSRVFSLRYGLTHVLQKVAKTNCANQGVKK